MKLSQLLSNLELHDAAINDLIYREVDNTIAIDLELLEEQPYKYCVEGTLMITGVSDFRIEPSSLTVGPTEDSISEIIDVRARLNQDDPTFPEFYKLIVVKTEYRTRETETVIIEFHCTGAEWRCTGQPME